MDINHWKARQIGRPIDFASLFEGVEKPTIIFGAARGGKTQAMMDLLGLEPVEAPPMTLDDLTATWGQGDYCWAGVD